MKQNRLLAGLLSLQMLLAFAPAYALAAEETLTNGQIVKSSAAQTAEETLENGLLSINKQVLATEDENRFQIQLDVTTAEDLRQMELPANAAVFVLVDKSSSLNGNSEIIPDLEELNDVVAQFDLPVSAEDFPARTDYAKETGALTDVDDMLNANFVSEEPDLTDEYAVRADTSVNFAAVKQAVYNCYHRRAWFERKAVIDFLDAYTADDSADRYFALGVFHQDASVKADWQTVDSGWQDDDSLYTTVTDYTKNEEQWNTNTQNNFQNDPSPLTYTRGSGSNLEAAYLLARNMMHKAFDEQNGELTSANVPLENRHVIIVSDGEPSWSCLTDARDAANSDWSDTGKIKGDKTTYGQAYTEDQLESMSEIAQSDDFSLDVVWYGEATLGNSIYKDDPARFADSFQGAEDEDLSQLGMSGIFRELASIESIAYPWSVSDPMGEHIEFTGVPEQDGVPQRAITEKNGALIWDLTQCTPVDTTEMEIENGSRTLSHYRLTYSIALDNRADGFVSRAALDTNGETVLTYTVTNKTDGAVNGYEKRTARFDIPQVQGYLADVTIQKATGSGAPLSDATFALTDADGKTRTAVSDETGAVKFEKIPSGYAYTLTETAAPAGYDRSEASYAVQVRYGAVSFGEDGAPTLTVVNTATGGSNGGDNGGGNNSNHGNNNNNTVNIEDEQTPLAAALDSDDHFAYIIGYPVDYRTGEKTEDKTLWPVRPEQNIDRQEVATIFFRLLTSDSRIENWSQTNSFPDVAASRWSNNAISTMTNAGILNGYEDGTFRPEQAITRAEFAAIAARFDSSLYVGEHQFSDIGGHWAAEYIDRAAQKGWVNGYPDGTFRPDQPITRAEAMTLINAVLGRRTHAENMLNEMNHWPDNAPDAWYYEAVQEATNGHDYERENPTAYETWTAMQPARDWSLLERQWSVAAAAKNEAAAQTA